MNDYISGLLKYHYTVTENPNPDDFGMHAHDTCELFFFIDGDATYYVEGNIYTLQKNDIMIMRQCETHRLQINRNCRYERMAVHFSPSIVYDNFPKDFLRPFYSRPLGKMNLYRAENFATDHYLSCIKTICKSISEKKSSEHIIAPLVSLLVEICDAYDNKDESEYTVQTGDLAIDMAAYINKNIFSKINLNMISEEFFMSNSQANRIFKKAIGTSIWEYVIIKRLLAAKDMLSSGKSAQVTALQCGFSDYSSFYRAYKKHFGVNPKTDYKK